MKKLTKKSLDELAKTMNVIPENERDSYWGMYEYDCFWRCVSYLKGTGITESAAASYATAYYAAQYSGSDAENIAQATSYLAQNGAQMTKAQMKSYDNYNGINRNHIQGFPPDALSKYGLIVDEGHVVVLKNLNPNGGFDMYCPQTDTYFTMSKDDYAKRVY